MYKRAPASMAHVRKAARVSMIPERFETPIPADHVPGPKQGEWTYNHYAALPATGHRYEIIDGVLYMSPAPSSAHQDAVNLIAYYLTGHVQIPGLGRVSIAPQDVELAPNMVLQPDVIVVLKKNLAIRKASRIVGAPDLVIEVASPGTGKHDRLAKLNAYERAGVPEYWIVDVKAQTIEVFVLEGEAYHSAGVFSGEQTLSSKIVPDLPVRVQQIFA